MLNVLVEIEFLEVVSVVEQREEVRADYLECAEVLLSHAADLVGLVRLRDLDSQLVELRFRSFFHEENEDEVVETPREILADQSEVLRRGSEHVNDRQTRALVSFGIDV